VKKILFIALFLIESFGFLMAQDAASVMTLAMQLYQAGNYPEMVKLIENNRQLLEKSEMYAGFLYVLGG